MKLPPSKLQFHKSKTWLHLYRYSVAKARIGLQIIAIKFVGTDHWIAVKCGWNLQKSQISKFHESDSVNSKTSNPLYCQFTSRDLKKRN